jgi:hypothetical protein
LRLAHPVALAADQVFGRHLHVVERNLVSDIAHHVERLAHDLEARQVHIDDEDAQAAARSFFRIGGGDELQEIGALGMRDEALVAVDEVMIALADRAGLHAAGIAAGFRLGLREGGGFFAAQQRIEIALLHLFGEPQQDRARRGPEHAVAAIGERDRAGNLLPHHRERQQAQALAAELGRRIELPKAQFARLGFKRSLDLRLELGTLHAVHFDRDQFAIDIFAHRFPQQTDVLGQFEIHATLPSSQPRLLL